MQERQEVFVPQPRSAGGTDPVAMAPLTHIFDSNSIRALGRLDDSTWQHVRAAWKAKNLTTGWIPWAVREVAGTNFIDRDGIIVQQYVLDEIVRAVQRFDEFAEGDVLPEFNQLIRFSLFEYAGAAGGPSHICENEDDYRKRIFLCKRLVRRDQIGKDPNRDGSYFLGFEDPEGGYFGHVVKETFVDHTENAIAAWKKLITIDETATDVQVIRDILRQLQKLVVWQGNKLGVPHDVLQRVLDKWNAAGENPDTTFVFAALVESWYYVEFARGHFTRRRRENDGHDIQISSYLSRAKQLVTADADLRILLSHVTKEPEKRIMHPDDFIAQMSR